MNIGVIGPGDIGEVIVRKLRDADYPVKMATSIALHLPPAGRRG
jgi:predicted dinucleotide-binding enzyme